MIANMEELIRAVPESAVQSLSATGQLSEANGDDVSLWSSIDRQTLGLWISEFSPRPEHLLPYLCILDHALSTSTSDSLGYSASIQYLLFLSHPTTNYALYFISSMVSKCFMHMQSLNQVSCAQIVLQRAQDQKFAADVGAGVSRIPASIMPEYVNLLALFLPDQKNFVLNILLDAVVERPESVPAVMGFVHEHVSEDLTTFYQHAVYGLMDHADSLGLVLGSLKQDVLASDVFVNFIGKCLRVQNSQKRIGALEILSQIAEFEEGVIPKVYILGAQRLHDKVAKVRVKAHQVCSNLVARMAGPLIVGPRVLMQMWEDAAPMERVAILQHVEKIVDSDCELDGIAEDVERVLATLLSATLEWSPRVGDALLDLLLALLSKFASRRLLVSAVVRLLSSQDKGLAVLASGSSNQYDSLVQELILGNASFYEGCFQRYFSRCGTAGASSGSSADLFSSSHPTEYELFVAFCFSSATGKVSFAPSLLVRINSEQSFRVLSVYAPESFDSATSRTLLRMFDIKKVTEWYTPSKLTVVCRAAGDEFVTEVAQAIGSSLSEAAILVGSHISLLKKKILFPEMHRAVSSNPFASAAHVIAFGRFALSSNPKDVSRLIAMVDSSRTQDLSLIHNVLVVYADAIMLDPSLAAAFVNIADSILSSPALSALSSLTISLLSHLLSLDYLLPASITNCAILMLARGSPILFRSAIQKGVKRESLLIDGIQLYHETRMHQEQRFKAYRYMVTEMKLSERFRVFMKIVDQIAQMCDAGHSTTYPTLEDMLYVLTLPDLSSFERLSTVQEEEAATHASVLGLISSGVRDRVLPVISQLKRFLQQMRSPLLKYVLDFLVLLLENKYLRNSIREWMDLNPQDAKEIEYEVRIRSSSVPAARPQVSLQDIDRLLADTPGKQKTPILANRIIAEVDALLRSSFKTPQLKQFVRTADSAGEVRSSASSRKRARAFAEAEHSAEEQTISEFIASVSRTPSVGLQERRKVYEDAVRENTGGLEIADSLDTDLAMLATQPTSAVKNADSSRMEDEMPVRVLQFDT
eukprot:ANDGO_03786.mRNA.1 hypothetical protein